MFLLLKKKQAAEALILKRNGDNHPFTGECRRKNA